MSSRKLDHTGFDITTRHDDLIAIALTLFASRPVRQRANAYMTISGIHISRTGEIHMARTGIISFISALGLLLSPMSLNAGQRESAFFAQAPIHAWHGERFTIIRIDSLNEFDGLRAMLENWMATYPDQLAGMQAAILANRPLASALRAKHVQINNVGAIQQAFNGNLVFYLR
jgi:hypothetical protein